MPNNTTLTELRVRKVVACGFCGCSCWPTSNSCSPKITEKDIGKLLYTCRSNARDARIETPHACWHQGHACTRVSQSSSQCYSQVKTMPTPSLALAYRPCNVRLASPSCKESLSNATGSPSHLLCLLGLLHQRVT